MTRTVKTKRTLKAKPVKAAGGGTFTTVQLAKEQGVPAKTMRARIRRQIGAGKDGWKKLMIKVEGKPDDELSHTFRDNKTTRNAIKELLA